jgi:hypothetical protein
LFISELTGFTTGDRLLDSAEEDDMATYKLAITKDGEPTSSISGDFDREEHALDHLLETLSLLAKVRYDDSLKKDVAELVADIESRQAPC